jgi:hypothetical protein
MKRKPIHWTSIAAIGQLFSAVAVARTRQVTARSAREEAHPAAPFGGTGRFTRAV